MRVSRSSLASFLCIAFAAMPTDATLVVVTVPPSTPSDAAIYLAGSSAQLGVWKADGVKLTRQSDGTFAGDIDGPAEFKVTRGTWATVEKDPAGNEIGNRRLDAGAAESRVTVARWAEASAATTRASSVVGELRIEQVGGRTIRVWLPPGYSAGDARYPVLYMHDGQNLFDAATSAFGVEWQVDETLTRLIEAKTIPPIVVVGIDNAGAARIDEYTVTQDKGRGGAGDAYERFVVDLVKPHVDARFRTKADRANTFVGGSSLGGLISLDIIHRFPDLFGGAIALSPSLWWFDESLTKDFERTPLRDGAHVSIEMGRREGDDVNARLEYVAQAERLGRALKGMHVTYNVAIQVDGEHNEASWAQQFPGAIQVLFFP